MKTEKFLIGLGIMCLITSGVCGFIDPEAPVSTVAEVYHMRDDTPVILEGKITKHLQKDRYLFSDSTGQITVEIDTKDWHGTHIHPTDSVRVYGEIDQDLFKTEVDAYAIEKIPPQK